MLRTNLSTRPFYNDRAVKTVLASFGVLAIALMFFNVYEIIRLRQQSQEARETVTRNDEEASDLRQKAQLIRQSIDRVKLDAVQTAAREANLLIDRRTFSWTELLNHFQTTLPPEVRIAGVMPQIDSNGRRLVQISVFSRRAEDLEEFMDALEKTGAFTGVLPRSEQPDEAGVMRSELQAYYTPVSDRAAALAPGASGGQAGTAGSSSEPASDRPVNARAAGNVSPGGPR